MKRSELFFTSILLPLDIAMTLLSFAVAFYIRGKLHIFDTPFNAKISDYVLLSIYFTPILVAIYAINGLYYTKYRKSLVSEFYRIFESNSTALAILILGLFFTKVDIISRLILLFIWVLGVLLVFISRLSVRIIQRSLLRGGIGRRNLAVIGDQKIARFIATEIGKNPLLGYKFVGVISTGQDSEIKTLGNPENFQEIIKQYQIDEVVISDNNSSGFKKLDSLIDYCGDNHLGLIIVPRTSSDFSLKLSASSIGSLTVLEVVSTPLEGWGRIVKRLSDIIFSIICLVISSPFWIIIGIIQKLSSKGPILYSHHRVGRDGKAFTLYKFRSMYVNAEDRQNKYWTEEKDDRITPLGKIIRKTNLDELPQLWNILRGDMSFVGPRPEQPRFVERFSKVIPNYSKRHRIKSGLTGWAQVNGLKGDTSINERVRYDMFYIENWSIWFDMVIIYKTLLLILYELFKGKYEYRSGS